MSAGGRTGLNVVLGPSCLGLLHLSLPVRKLTRHLIHLQVRACVNTVFAFLLTTR